MLNKIRRKLKNKDDTIIDIDKVIINSDSYKQKYMYKEAIDQLNKIDASKLSRKQTEMIRRELIDLYELTHDYQQAYDILLLITAGSKSNEDKLRLASLAERLSNFEEALTIYQSIDHTTNALNIDYHYNVGYCLYQLKKYEHCAKHFYEYNKSCKIKKNEILINSHFVRAVSAAEAGNYKLSAELFERLIFSFNNHYKNIYIMCANQYVFHGDYKAASKFYIHQKIEPQKSLTNRKYTRREKFAQVFQAYAHNFEIEPHHIFYAAHRGTNFNGNPRAIYEKLKDNKELIHFILINDLTKIDQEIIDHPNIFIVKENSKLYFKVLATAKYIYLNSTLPFFYIPNEKQIVVNTWHGTPIKHLGYDVALSPYWSSRNVKTSFMKSTYLINQNDYTTQKLKEAYGLGNSSHFQNITTGYPRLDLTLSMSEERKACLLDKLDINDDKPIILYAPTYRDGDLAIESNKIIERTVEKLSSKKEFNFLFKGHYFEQASNIDIIQNIDTNELLAIADIVITDYSSLAIDYLSQEKPLVLYAFDLQQYKQYRGLYFDIGSLTDAICENLEQLQKLINELVTKPQLSTTQRIAKQKFCKYDTGDVANQLINLANTSIRKCEDINTHNVIYAGDFILQSAIKIDIIDAIKKSLAVDRTPLLLLPSEIFKHENIDQELNELRSKGCNFVINYANISATREQYDAYNLFEQYQRTLNGSHAKLLSEVFNTEFKRIFGNFEIDKIIDLTNEHKFINEVLNVKIK